MSRLLKLIGIVVGALVLLFVAVAVGLAVFVDPNDYKDQITAAVGQATGRKLTLEGDLELHLFPALSISVGKATLGNAPGFGNAPFAEIRGASLSVRLLPLLTRHIEIGRAELEGLVLNLERDAQGRDNWQDLGGPAAPAGSAPPAGAGAPPPSGAASGAGANVNLDVGRLEIADSEVKWSDAATGSRWTLGAFNLAASGFGPNAAFPVSMSFSLKGQGLDAALTLDTKATVSLASERYRLDDLHVKVDGQGASWPGGRGQARLDFGALVADLKAQTLALDRLDAAFLGVEATGSLKGRNLLGNLALSGQVDIRQFDPSAVLKTFGADIKTADAGVLKRASAKATFVYDSSRIGLDDMKLALDDSTLTGKVAVQGQALRFDLKVDQINADRYLPPAEQAAPAANEGSLDAVDLPVDVLKTVDASGNLGFGKAQFAGLTLTDAGLALVTKGGHAELKPTAKLYGGDFAGDVKLDVQGDAVKLAYAQKLTGVDMLPLGRDLLKSEMVSGKGSVTLDLTATGSNVGQMRRALDGNVSFSVTNGALEGLDLWYELRRARAVLNRTGAPPRPAGPRRTPFSSVSASGVVDNAVLTNKDLNATLEQMKLDGKGTVNLLTEALDFDLVAAVLDSPAVKGDPLMADLAGGTLPFKVTGTAAEPSVKPDFAAVAKAKVQKQVEQKVEQRKEETKDKLRDKLRGLLNR